MVGLVPSVECLRGNIYFFAIKIVCSKKSVFSKFHSVNGVTVMRLEFFQMNIFVKQKLGCLKSKGHYTDTRSFFLARVGFFNQISHSVVLGCMTDLKSYGSPSLSILY